LFNISTLILEREIIEIVDSIKIKQNRIWIVRAKKYDFFKKFDKSRAILALVL
jgi:hypothetical protein